MASVMTFAWLVSDVPGETPSTNPVPGNSSQSIVRLIKDGRYAEAEQRARALLSEVESTSGQASIEAAQVIDLLVEALWRDGRAQLPETQALAKRAVAIKEGDSNVPLPELARSLRNLGTVLEESGDTSGARPLYERELAIQEQAFGPAHPEVATALIDLANLFVNIGKDQSARPLYERALAIQQKTLGADEPAVTHTLHNLALLQYRAGDYPTAVSLFEQTLAAKERIFGPRHLEVAWTLNALAIVLEETGDYPRARSLYERALEIKSTVLGPEHLQVAQVLNNLGMLLRKTGNYAEAASSFERALAIEETTLGPGHADVAMTLQNLGDVRRLTGDFDGAKSHYERALAIRRKTLGENRQEVAESLNALASLLAENGDLKQARSLYEKALEVWQEALGPDHPDLTPGLIGLARVRVAEGDLTGARSLLERSLTIESKTLGPKHPRVAESLDALGKVFARMGDGEKALSSSLRAEEIGRSHLKLTARSLSEREALRYASIRPSGLDTALSLAAKGLGPAQRRKVFDALIRSRGIVLNEMASRRHLASRASDPEVARLSEMLAGASRRLANLTTLGPSQEDPGKYRIALDRARKDKEGAERALAAKSDVFERERARDQLGLAEVGASLPSGSALLAYARYQGRDVDAPFYMAFVLRGRSDGPSIVPLGSADEIDTLVSAWVKEVGRAPVMLAGWPDRTETAIRSIGTDLRARIWDPVLPKLGQVSRVFVVWDGALHLLNLAALPIGKTQYLVETGPLVHYLSSERELVPTGAPGRRGDGLLALGGPAFDESIPRPRAGLREESPPPRGVGMTGPSSYRGERPSCADFQSIRFPDLPGSAREVDEIVSLWKNAPGEGTHVIRLTGPQAGEAAFKEQAPGRRVLHLATHGFFLGTACGEVSATARGIGGLASVDLKPPPSLSTESPLLRSGLALAGANHRRTAGAEEEDGVLTAEEISAMDLSGVEWAVLSACDTGIGELAAGEGVLGLRRSFQVAGVATVIMSLWPVEDDAAREWMRALYEERLVAHVSTAEAVRAASLKVLKRRREENGTGHPFYWAGFVAAGDWR